MANNPYNTSYVVSNPFYGRTMTEANMRDEMNATLDGKFPETPKGQIISLRKMRRDSSGTRIKCACVSLTTNEPDKDTLCPYCIGEGYFWDEILIIAYRIQVASDTSGALADKSLGPGMFNVPITTFYVKATVDITEDDRIVELVTDIEGVPVQPYRRRKLYRIGRAVDFRADNGKLDYWQLYCASLEPKYLNR
jgi:hypothetical protein